jgi:hypothetical protein
VRLSGKGEAMLRVGSVLQGYSIEATDGGIGSVSDFLFDDSTWKIRWLVVDAGTWLTGRKVLVHPSALGTPDDARLQFPVKLTRQQVKDSPDVFRDQPVSRQMERNLYGYYGWDPLWGGSLFGMGSNAIAQPLVPRPFFGDGTLMESAEVGMHPEEGDPHLRSMASIAGYHMHATDGVIGHVETLLIDDATWSVRYLIVDTRNWWFGNSVLVSPYAVKEIDWSINQIRLDVTRDQVKSSPPWQPAETVNEEYEKRLHAHYQWPGYGW